MKNFWISIRITLAMCLLLGVGYVLVLRGVSAVAGPGGGQAETLTFDGRTVGAANVGQQFTDTRYFWGRPSAVDYNVCGWAGGQSPLPPVADFGMKEVRTKKKKHMTNDVNGMKKKCGRPALGRTRKLTRGVTVKFSPVSYEALRFRAGKSGRSLAVYIREAALAATVTARHTPEENALLRSLAGMANNLNQLTKLSHQTGFYRTRLLIEGLLGKLKRIMDDYRPKGG